MRIDKFLKLSRLIKRRTVAKEVASKGRIQVNSQPAKASTDVKVGDEIAIQFGHKRVTVRVESLEEHVRKEEAGRLYKLLKEEQIGRDE